jgi:hypothetical protein
VSAFGFLVVYELLYLLFKVLRMRA